MDVVTAFSPLRLKTVLHICTNSQIICFHISNISYKGST